MDGFRVLLTFLATIVIISDPRSSAEDGPATKNVYHGRYTRDIPSAEYLVPRRVFENGNFYKYELPNFYDRGEVSARRKRSTEEAEEDKVHLVLPFNGLEHHVELTPYHDFISPEMVIETRGAGIRTNLDEAVRFKRAPDQQCYYRGTIRDHNASRAALSLCDGVVGYMQTNHGRYFIEPANEAQPQHDGQHVHIAYQREAPHETNPQCRNNTNNKFCATEENWEAAWAEQLAKRAKRLLEANPAEKKGPSSGTHSIHRYIEIGLVADRRFLDFYNNSNYEQYLLTIMNMVSDFYHDKSIGNQIDVVVVRMIYLEKEKEEIDLLISPAAEETLHSFAKWAEKVNPKDHTHPNHFDVAVLVTRYDICSEGTNCNLMGLASVAAACDPERSAAINEDNGLLLGIVVAHEVGHVMGCSHDDVNISGCPPKDTTDDSYFIMSPIVFIYTIRWSTCSRRFVTSFLESGLGECLNDDPRNPPDRFKYPNMLPGAMYDGDYQCKMAIPGSTHCQMARLKVCDMLWCQVNNSCVSQGKPMAEGSKCGEQKWCIKKKCVDKGTRPAAVHGGWGSWGPMSSCSRTCGGGLKSSERECDNPPPSNGGRYCMGERKRVSICNTTPCPINKPSYRAVQCSSFDKVKVLSDNILHTWQPYIDFATRDPCMLYCINEKRIVVKVKSVVNDTTPCKPGTNYMCIFGVCRKVGCDWVLDSNAVDDKCGICKGDGTKCKQVKGFFTQTKIVATYTKILTVPKGARSIRVWEAKPDTNAIAVKTEKGSEYCLNGNSYINRAGDYPCAKALIIYQYPEPEREEIEIKGPIAEDLRIEYAFFKVGRNPGVYWEYYLMSTNSSYTPKYFWDFVGWSACTVKCGGGTKVAEASCIEENGGQVSPNFCEGKPRPEPKSQICNAQPCPAKWRVSQWSKCSACDGKKGFRHRKVQCIRPAAHSGEDDIQANPDACKGRVPKQKEECVGKRPCKKTCPKKTRDASREVKARKPLSPEEQAKLINKFVDLSLAQYLEKSYGPSRGADEGANVVNLQQLFRDWPLLDEEKLKRGVCNESVCIRNCSTTSNSKFTTPKPGTIIKDSIPIENEVLMEAPVMEEGLQVNLSDRAFQESGDMVGVGIDTSRIKIYNGSAAVARFEELEGHTPLPEKKKGNYTNKS